MLAQVLDDHDAAALDFRILAHAFPTLALVEDVEKRSVRRVEVQFPRAVWSVEVAGVFLHVALERPVEAIGDAPCMHERNVGKVPRDGNAAHVEDKHGIDVGFFFHREFPAEVLPARAQVQNTSVGVGRICFAISLDVHVERSRLVGLGPHAEHVGHALVERQVLLELEIPGILAALFDIEVDHSIFHCDLALATPEIGRPAAERFFGAKVPIFDEVRPRALGTRSKILVLDKVRDDARVLDAKRTVDGDFLAPAHQGVVRAVDGHVHLGTVEVARAPAPGEPADVQAFAFGHDKLVRDFPHAAGGHGRKFPDDQRNLAFDGFFEHALDAVPDGRIAGRDRIVAFGRPPHVNRENQVMFRIGLQKLGAHVQDVLFALSPFVGVDHYRDAHARGTELRHDDVVGVEKFFGVLRLVARLVTDIQNQVFLVVVNHLDGLFAEPKIEGVAETVPVAGRVMDFRDGNHAVCDAERNNIVEIADAATSVPYNSYAVRTSLCNFGDGLAFTVSPNEHVVHATENNFFVILAVQKRILNEKTRFYR